MHSAPQGQRGVGSAVCGWFNQQRASPPADHAPPLDSGQPWGQHRASRSVRTSLLSFDLSYVTAPKNRASHACLLMVGVFTRAPAVVTVGIVCNRGGAKGQCHAKLGNSKMMTILLTIPSVPSRDLSLFLHGSDNTSTGGTKNRRGSPKRVQFKDQTRLFRTSGSLSPFYRAQRSNSDL